MAVKQLDDQAIFEVARKIATREARQAYLAQVCGDDLPTSQRIEALLRAHDESASFLETPPSAIVREASPTLDQAPLEKPGIQIGPYKLLQQIGEGGMGVVYMAEQTEPVKRRVALKIIKPGMDSRQVIARFEAERQALSLMDHPNIARVLDAGTTESGRPYFVMELVKGQPITVYCDEHHLTPRQRLELLLPVCQAIQHAHQKGIIHRDIKPTNILVAEYDNQPVPKVIDFGVAKAISQTLTEKTMFTGLGQIVGTLEYMSPEQAKVNQLDIDTRSDIYSLGVLLYELLTGSTPFDKNRLRSAAWDEMLRIIREEEPEKPSTRLSSADTLPSIAANRNMEPARLGRTVRGELDWIVMKALEKDRNRRYETANGFAADIQRYLADEPVQACPPSAAYRFRKFARRNWRVVATMLLITVSLVLATIISLYYAYQAKTDRQFALQKAKEANTSAETARAEADKSDAVIRLLQDMLLSSNPDAAKGANYTLRELLDEFSKRLDKQLHKQPEVEATLRQIVGSVYTELRLHDRAEPHLQRSLHLHREVFGDDHLKVASILGRLARNRWMQNAGDDVEGFARESLQIYQKHGDVAGELGARNLLLMNLWGQFRLDDAERMAEDTIVFAHRRNLDNDPVFPTILHNLSSIKNAKGDNAAALRLAREAVDKHLRAYGETKNSTGWGYFYLGWALRDDGRLAEAEESFRKSLSIFRRLFLASDVRAVGRAVVELRETLKAQGNAAAVANLEREYPREMMAASYDLAARVDTLYRKPTRAVERWRTAIEFEPENYRYWQPIGVANYRAGKWTEALDALEESCRLENGKGGAWQWLWMAMAHWKLGHKDEARSWYDKAVTLKVWSEELRRVRTEAEELLELKKK